jgi:hypothetical protein
MELKFEVLPENSASSTFCEGCELSLVSSLKRERRDVAVAVLINTHFRLPVLVSCEKLKHTFELPCLLEKW